MATTIKTQWGEVTPEELSNIAAYTSKLQGNFTPAEITKMTKNPYFKEMATGGYSAVFNKMGVSDPTVQNELYNKMQEMGQGGVNSFDAFTKIATDPTLYSKTAASQAAEQTAQKQTEQQNTAFQNYVKQFQQADSPWMQLQGMQTNQLNTNMEDLRQKQMRELTDSLATRGIDPSAVSGAFGGGTAAVGSQIGKATQQGLNTIGQQTLQGITGEANQLAQGQSGLTSQMRASNYGDIANQLANDYNEQMTKQYYNQMSQMNQPNIWNTIGQIGQAIPGINQIGQGLGLWGNNQQKAPAQQMPGVARR